MGLLQVMWRTAVPPEYLSSGLIALLCGQCLIWHKTHIFFTDFYFQWLFFVLFCFICSFCLFPISARSLLCFLMRCFLHLSNFLRCPLIQSSGEGCSILFVFTWPLLMLECFWMYCVIPDCGLTVNKLYSRKSCQGVEGLFFRRDFCVCF